MVSGSETLIPVSHAAKQGAEQKLVSKNWAHLWVKEPPAYERHALLAGRGANVLLQGDVLVHMEVPKGLLEEILLILQAKSVIGADDRTATFHV